MSAVKHQPATPLPWRATNWTDHAKGTVVVDDASHPLGKAKVADCAGASWRREGDAAYIAHAANAYPKLVEALRELNAAWNHESAAVRQIAKGRATRLLKELGEE